MDRLQLESRKSEENTVWDTRLKKFQVIFYFMAIIATLFGSIIGFLYFKVPEELELLSSINIVTDIKFVKHSTIEDVYLLNISGKFNNVSNRNIIILCRITEIYTGEYHKPLIALKPNTLIELDPPNSQQSNLDGIKWKHLKREIALSSNAVKRKRVRCIKRNIKFKPEPNEFKPNNPNLRKSGCGTVQPKSWTQFNSIYAVKARPGDVFGYVTTLYIDHSGLLFKGCKKKVAWDIATVPFKKEAVAEDVR